MLTVNVDMIGLVHSQQAKSDMFIGWKNCKRISTYVTNPRTGVEGTGKKMRVR